MRGGRKSVGMRDIVFRDRDPYDRIRHGGRWNDFRDLRNAGRDMDSVTLQILQIRDILVQKKSSPSFLLPSGEMRRRLDDAMLSFAYPFRPDRRSLYTRDKWQFVT